MKGETKKSILTSGLVMFILAALTVHRRYKRRGQPSHRATALREEDDDELITPRSELTSDGIYRPSSSSNHQYAYPDFVVADFVVANDCGGCGDDCDCGGDDGVLCGIYNNKELGGNMLCDETAFVGLEPMHYHPT